MRCPDCNKFVSYDTDEEPEEDSVDVSGTVFMASYRRVLPCVVKVRRQSCSICRVVGHTIATCPRGDRPL